MSLYHAHAGQAEIIRSIQKDQSYTEEIRANLSDLLMLISQKNWFKYNHLCKIIAEILYHQFSILNNLQTLGEEYTGIIQLDSNYLALPNKILQMAAIILEYGGEYIISKILNKLEMEIENSKELLPAAKNRFFKAISAFRFIIPYIQGFHLSLFYIQGGKYHISKRLTGVNYILIRHWLKENHSLIGYKILGIITFLQLILSFIIKVKAIKDKRVAAKIPSSGFVKRSEIPVWRSKSMTQRCPLCMDYIKDISVTQCGHLFCWSCIFEWLDERQVCPVCRESIKKSRIIHLQNYGTPVLE